MQLAGQSDETGQKISPSIYAALVDSLFQTPAPLLAGAAMVAIAAAMTAIKTGLVLLWPCALFLAVSGAARAFDMHWYKARNPP